jgi:hypothetical protein
MLRTASATLDMAGMTEVQRQAALSMLPIIPLLVQELRKGMTGAASSNLTRERRKTKTKRALQVKKDDEQPEERLVILVSKPRFK